MTDITEEAPEELKPKRRKVTPAETAAKQKEPDFVSPTRSATEEPEDVMIDDPEALAIMEAAAEIFADDMSPAEADRLRKAVGEARGRVPEKTLAQKLVAVMGAIDGVEKKGRNTAQAYSYQRATDVTMEVRPEFIKQGIVLTTSIDDVQVMALGATKSGTTQWMTTIQGAFTVTDGVETLTFTGAGQGVDTGDKGIYKAITGMLKYGLRTLLLIPDEKMDPEVEREDERPVPATGPSQITITQAAPQGVTQGGRQAGATSAQVDAIKRYAGQLSLTTSTLNAMIVSVLGEGVDPDEATTEAAYAAKIMDHIASLTFQNAGKIAKALAEAANNNGGG